ncbi:MAG: hypothetical protein Q7K42_02020 [Candidatus Diapherotrites archaeon]|nr:hypothetical protein [Candidatus Diapherotrites archaeon]
MSLEIKHKFFPYRLVASRGSPVELTLDIANNSEKDLMLSLQLELGRGLGLDKAGIKCRDYKQLGIIEKGKSLKFVYSVFATPSARKGEVQISLKLTEHFNNYNYVVKEYSKDFALVVD